MADCLITLAVAFGPSEPYVSNNIKVAPAEEYSAGQYRVTTAYAQIPLTDPPTVVPFPQGEVFSFITPNKVQRYLLIPNTGAADFDDLEEVVPVIDTPGYLGDTVMTGVLDDTDSDFRELLDTLFAELGPGIVTDAAVGAIVNNGDDTKNALGDEMTDDTSPLAVAADVRTATGVLASINDDADPIRIELDELYKYGNRRVISVFDLPTSGLQSYHRGAGAYPPLFPDNSMSGYRYAVDRGADIVDVDYRITLDNQEIAMHDDDLLRTTAVTVSQLVSDTPSGLLPKIDMRYASGPGHLPEPIPFLEQLIDEIAGRSVMTIEAKDGIPSVVPLANIYKKYGLERSALINCGALSPTVADAVTAAGCFAHVYACDTPAKVVRADQSGAFLIEIPLTAADLPGCIAAAVAATNIQRWIAGPIHSRVNRDAAIAAGLMGWVSDSVGYLDDDDCLDNSLPTWIKAQRVPPGFLHSTDSVDKTHPLFQTDGAIALATELASAGKWRRFLVPQMSMAKPTDYYIYALYRFGAFVADTGARTDARVCCPDDRGTGQDADSQGNIFTIRKSGSATLWAAPASFGGGVSIGTFSSTAIGDAGGDVLLRLHVTATSLELERMTGYTLDPATNLLTSVGTSLATTGVITGADATRWRGDYVWLGGGVGGSLIHKTGLVTAYITDSAGVPLGTLGDVAAQPAAGTILIDTDGVPYLA